MFMKKITERVNKVEAFLIRAFYYVFIKFIEKKIINKIVGDIYTIVLPSLSKILENNNPKTPIGLLLTQLVVDNFIKEKTFIEVQLNLKELKKLSILLELDKKLQTALGFLVP